jgi:hypothetical protein
VVAPGVHSNSVMENGPKEPDVFLGPIWPPDIKPVRGEVSLNKALPLKLDRLGELKPGVEKTSTLFGCIRVKWATASPPPFTRIKYQF